MLKLDSITYIPPQDPPTDGSVWPEERDWPGVSATVSLPINGHGLLLDQYRSASRMCCGEQLHPEWGSRFDGRRMRSEIFRAPTLEAAEADARNWHAAGNAVVSDIILDRAARLAEREATIARAHSRPGSVIIPEPQG